MDERPGVKQKMSIKKDTKKGALISPFTSGLSGEIKFLAGVWASTLFVFLGGCFAVPSLPINLLVYGGLAVNGICLVWYLRLMKRIRRAAEDFSFLVQRAGDMVWGLDSDLHFTGLGGAVATVTGRDARTLWGTSFIDLLHPKIAEKFKILIQQNKPFSMVAGIRHPHGGEPVMEICAVPVSTGRAGDPVWQGSLRDISRPAHLEAVNIKLKKKLADADKLKNLGLLAGSVAHDLNNILSGIATYPEILLLDDGLDPKIRQGLAMIKDSGRKASSVVSDLLTISRGIKADKQILNINAVIERYMAAAEFRKIHQTYNQVEIEVLTDPELLNINGSYIHIEKAVMNLVLNAVEETAEQNGGRVVLSTANYYVDEVPGRTSHTDLAPGEYVVLQVEDNGAGIPEDCLGKIYEPFFTQKELGKSGTGLGLTVVRKRTIREPSGSTLIPAAPGLPSFFRPSVRSCPSGRIPALWMTYGAKEKPCSL